MIIADDRAIYILDPYACFQCRNLVRDFSKRLYSNQDIPHRFLRNHDVQGTKNALPRF